MLFGSSLKSSWGSSIFFFVYISNYIFQFFFLSIEDLPFEDD